MMSSFHEASEEELCRYAPYDAFAEFLLNEHNANEVEDKRLKSSSVCTYLCCALNMAEVKFKSTTSNPDTKIFFTCLEACGTEASKWLVKLKHKLLQDDFIRRAETGQAWDESVEPVYAEHIMAIVGAYKREGTAEVRTQPSRCRDLNPNPQP